MSSGLTLCTLSGMEPQERSSISENVTRVVRILLGRDDLKQNDLAKIMGYDESTVSRPSMVPPEDRTPNWLPDPTGRATNRYWDGNRWTAHVSQADGSTSEDW